MKKVIMYTCLALASLTQNGECSERRSFLDSSPEVNNFRIVSKDTRLTLDKELSSIIFDNITRDNREANCYISAITKMYPQYNYRNLTPVEGLERLGAFIWNEFNPSIRSDKLYLVNDQVLRVFDPSEDVYFIAFEEMSKLFQSVDVGKYYERPQKPYYILGKYSN